VKAEERRARTVQRYLQCTNLKEHCPPHHPFERGQHHLKHSYGNFCVNRFPILPFIQASSIRAEKKGKGRLGVNTSGIRKEHIYGLSHTASHRVRQRGEETQRKSLRPKVSKKQKSQSSKGESW